MVATEEATEELNHFLRSQKIVDVKKELATIDGNSCWAFCVTYIETSSSTSAEVAKLNHAIMNVCHDTSRNCRVSNRNRNNPDNRNNNIGFRLVLPQLMTERRRERL